MFTAHVVGDNLRHSPVALRYPRWLEHVFISPAQHQYHHTRSGSRRNYGGVMAIWDWSFRSLRTARADDVYDFGLHDPDHFTSVFKLLWLPFQQIWLSVLRLCSRVAGKVSPQLAGADDYSNDRMNRV